MANVPLFRYGFGHLCIVAVVGFAVGSNAPRAGADITVDGWTLTTSAVVPGEAGNDATADESESSPYPVELPFDLSHTATALLGNEQSTATSTYAFSTVGDTASFSLSWEHAANNGLGSQASSNGSIFFSTPPGVPVSYALSGDYSLTGSGTIRLQVSLAEVNGASLFENAQESQSTLGEVFSLGLEEGDSDNVLSGSLSGMLAADTQYRLIYDYYIEGAGTAPGPSADGGLSLTLGSSAAVIPLPPSIALGLLGLGLVAASAKGTSLLSG